MKDSMYILITGGTSGIGSALCQTISNVGFKPIIGFNTQASLAQSLAKKYDGHAVHLNMHEETSIINGVADIQKMIGEKSYLHTVVLAASPPPDLQSFTQLTQQEFQQQLQVNVLGPRLLLSSLIKHYFKKQKRGKIVGILSQGLGDSNHPISTGMASYLTAKGALRTMLDTCAAEYPWLDVKNISPGFTKTKMLDVFDPRYLELVQNKHKFSTPEEVAEIILREILV